VKRSTLAGGNRIVAVCRSVLKLCRVLDGTLQVSLIDWIVGL